MQAIILANSMMFATPAYSKNDANRKTNAWNRFMDSLDWDRITSKDKKDIRKVVSVFSKVPGVMIKTGKKKESKGEGGK